MKKGRATMIGQQTRSLFGMKKDLDLNGSPGPPEEFSASEISIKSASPTRKGRITP
jgi:hypothetical protein